MVSPRLGTQTGLFRLATIRKYNDDGTVLISLNEGGLSEVRQDIIVPIPMAWSGQEGEFLGGFPRLGSTVIVSQGQGGQWFVVSYAPSDRVFGNNTSLTLSSINDNRMAALRPGRILAQVKDGSRIFLDPEIGIQVGKENNFLHANANLNILSHNFNAEMSFTETARSINNVVKRDLFENANRNILGSTLDSQLYERSLFTIGLDPSALTSPTTVGPNVRNPSLVENREVVYEFAHSFGFTTDEDENTRYGDPKAGQPKLKVSRREMRSDALSLSLEAPNHLIETIKGTAVDIFGNIVDINRNPIPLGKIDALSLRKNPDKQEAFTKMREQMRKSIAYHFEINARKPVPDPEDDDSNYLRHKSRFSLDIDKEGQFKLNIPSSSNVGNIPLLTRTENYSVLLSKDDNTINPNSFIRNTENKDIYLQSFAGKANVKLSSSEATLDGYEAPIDLKTDEPIKFGTAFHDVTKTCSEFQEIAGYIQAGVKLVNFDSSNRLNSTDVWKPLEKVVSDTVVVSGADANGGGRSGMITLDGMVIFNVGANTIDRQSIWFDYAGSVIGNVGRDKRGISYAATLDGDLFLQVGGTGIGNEFDSRFANENDALRTGTVDIRVFVNGQLMILRMGPEGFSIISPGTITFSAQQSIILRSNSDIKFEAENIVMYAETTKRIINRMPPQTIG